MKAVCDEIARELGSERKRATIRIQTRILKAISDFMHEREMPQLMPVMLSPATDPLSHSTSEAAVEYGGQKLKLTKSMILHKQIALLSIPRLYVISPNIRLEGKEEEKTGRHLIEFSQLDMEFRDFSKEDFMQFAEALVVYVLGSVKGECALELGILGRKLKVPSIPFKRYESRTLAERGGIGPAVDELSEIEREPFWVMDLEREFYDREDGEKKGYFHNYDLVYPDGFGEALSGGEREFEHEKIVRRIKETGQDPKDFESYLGFAEKGHLQKSAGGGLGIERLVRYCAGLKDIKEVCLFPRKPGAAIHI